MTSHGVTRVQSTIPKTGPALEKELRQVEEYRRIDGDARNLVRNGRLDDGSLKATSKVLTWNPEHYTVWNDRRRILQALFALDDALSIKQRIEADLRFLLPLLLKYPKCYWIWNHRWWLLQQCTLLLSQDDAKAMWFNELQLDGKMLARDSRNFHGWGYRRKIIAELETFDNENAVKDDPDTSHKDQTPPRCVSEFDYTTTMINQNLSNFSAWHSRSHLIPQVLDHRGADVVERRAFFDSELALIKDAIFTDPYDQSLWFYHQYLVHILLRLDGAQSSWTDFSQAEQGLCLMKEMDDIREMLEDTTDCKWIYQNLLQLSSHLAQIRGELVQRRAGEVHAWFEQLQKLDPLRRGRWLDWERQMLPNGESSASEREDNRRALAQMTKLKSFFNY